jgi:hypothetical protein
VNVGWVAASLAMTLGACTAPPAHGGGIPIHHEGVAARMRLACGLGIATAAGATCATGEGIDAEGEGWDEIEKIDASPDAEANDAGPAEND